MWRRASRRLGVRVKRFALLIVAAAREWHRQRAPVLAAALAFYALFSIAPLLLIAVALVGRVLGRPNAQSDVVATVRALLSPDGVSALQLLMSSLRSPGQGLLAAVIGAAVVFFGATRLFSQMIAAFDQLWGTRSGGGAHWVRGVLKDRVLSFVLVFATGALMLLSVAAGTTINAISAFVLERLPGGNVLWQIGEVATSVVVISLAFAAIFRMMAASRFTWGDIWFGAICGSLLFEVGKLLISYYLSRLSVSSVYGAAGSLVVIMFWIYYSAQILFFGAQLTRARSDSGRRFREAAESVSSGQ